MREKFFQLRNNAVNRSHLKVSRVGFLSTDSDSLNVDVAVDDDFPIRQNVVRQRDVAGQSTLLPLVNTNWSTIEKPQVLETVTDSETIPNFNGPRRKLYSSRRFI